MQYDDFIYKMISLLMSWGVWNDSIKIIYGNKIYSPCRMPKSSSDKFFDFEDYMKREAIFKADKERNTFQDLNNVVISDVSEDDIEFQSSWPDKCEMAIVLNSPLSNLFAFGILSVDLDELPLSKKFQAFYEREELQERFSEEYDEEEIRINPEAYGFPSELEFDSSDAYEEFFYEELNRLKNEFIKNLSGEITYNNDLEAEICSLCVDNGLSYCGGSAYLFIGHDYF